MKLERIVEIQGSLLEKWRRWQRSRKGVTATERELRQVHRIRKEVVWMILSEVGEDVLRCTLKTMERNRKERGEADYTSLAEVWIASKKKKSEEPLKTSRKSKGSRKGKSSGVSKS